jgi:adenylate kinase
MVGGRLLFLGLPGSGKSTQSKRIEAAWGIPHLSTGGMLREAAAAGSELGRQASELTDQGRFAPDGVMIDLVTGRMAAEDCKEGFVLDGFPRTIVQAEALEDSGAGIDAAVVLDVPEETVFSRLVDRKTCPNCGLMYNSAALASRDGASCDRCGAKLVVRADDDAAVVRTRLRVYEEQTAPLVGFYEARGLTRVVDGTGEPGVVFDRIVAALGSRAG